MSDGYDERTTEALGLVDAGVAFATVVHTPDAGAPFEYVYSVDDEEFPDPGDAASIRLALLGHHIRGLARDLDRSNPDHDLTPAATASLALDATEGYETADEGAEHE